MNKPNGQQGGNRKPLKFENEFDFEQANSKFEELRSQLAKLKVGTEENKSTEQVILVSLLFPVLIFGILRYLEFLTVFIL